VRAIELSILMERRLCDLFVYRHDDLAAFASQNHHVESHSTSLFSPA
jgi:hypothetical protein